MKNYLYHFSLFLFLSIPTLIWADSVPIEGEWNERGLRSIISIPTKPFTVEQEGNTLYIHSNKQVKDVLIRITSIDGGAFCEDVYTFSANETIAIPLNNLPEGSYVIDFSHIAGWLSGEFVNP